MSDLIKLELLDKDGAIRETAEAAGATRSDFIKRVGIAGAGFVSAGVAFDGLLSPAQAAISTRTSEERRQDPQLRADARVPRGAFYAQAVASGAMSPTRWSRTSRPSSPAMRPRT